MKKSYLKSLKAIIGVGFVLAGLGVNAQSVCTSGPNYSTQSIIKDVAVTGTTSSINLISSTSNCTGYIDHSNMVADVTAGSSVNASVLVGACGSWNYTKGFKVFADWNHDGDFDEANEELFVSPVTGYGQTPATQNFTFTVPYGAFAGSTVFRVVVVEGSNVNGISGCGSYSYGQTRDFTIQVNKFAIDAGVSSLLSPNFPSCQIDSLTQVGVTNFGEDTLHTVTVNWSVNGMLQSPVVVTDSIAPGVTHPVDLGVYASGYNDFDTVLFWTSLVNNQVDSVVENDTLSDVLIASLNGTYEVGSGANAIFSSIQEALDAAKKSGVCGPTVLELTDTNYVGQFELESYSGMSSVNTITFASQTGNPEDVKVLYPSTASQDNYVFKLYDASYFKFESISIENTGIGNYGMAMDIWGSDSVSVNNCILKSPVISYSSSTPLRVYYLNSGSYKSSNNLRITNSTFIGGYRGMYIYLNTASTSNNMYIANNTLLNPRNTGIEVQRVNNLVFKNNYVASNSTNAYATGFRLLNIQKASITNNFVQGTTVWPIRGYYISNVNGDLSDYSIIANNRASLASPNADYGMNLYGCFLTQVANNSIRVKGGLSSRAMHVSNGSYTQLYNNIIVNDSTGTALSIDGSVFASDYNNLSAPTGVLVKAGSTNYSALSAWVSAASLDSNSLTIANVFSDTDLLKVCNDSLYQMGKPINGLVADFEGDPRSIHPSIGADEFKSLAEYQKMVDPTICNGQNLTIELPYFDTVIWNGIDTGSTFTVQNSGNVFVQIIDACVNMLDTITVNSQVVANINEDVICEGVNTVYTAGVTNALYQWSTGDTSETVELISPTHLTVTVTDEFGCVSSDSFLIELIQNVNLNGDKQFCEGSSVVLDANVPGTYNWSNGSNGQTLVANTAGLYAVTVSNRGCASTDSINVFEVLNPVVSFNDSSDALTVIFTNTSINVDSNTTYYWDFGDGNTSTEENPIHIYDWTGADSIEATVVLTVSNVCGDFVTQGTVRYGQAVGVNELTGFRNLNIYPNPAHDIVTIEFTTENAENVSVQLINMAGVVVKQKELEASANTSSQMNLADLPNGMYLVKVTTKNSQEIVKITKK